jgi:hypothetical protein
VVFPTSELKPLIATIAGRFIIFFNYSKTLRLETDAELSHVFPSIEPGSTSSSYSSRLHELLHFRRFLAKPLRILRSAVKD